MARAAALLQIDLLPALSRQFTNGAVTPSAMRSSRVRSSRSPPDAGHSDIGGALARVRERYRRPARGRRHRGVRWRRTRARRATAPRVADAAGGSPVFAIGIGSPDGIRDREVLGITAGDPAPRSGVGGSARLGGRAAASAARRSSCACSANGRLLESRRVTPVRRRIAGRRAASPSSPDPADADGLHRGDRRPGTASRSPRTTRAACSSAPPAASAGCSSIEGAPGYEHSFLTRAWTADPGLEIDSVVRKGKNDDGQRHVLRPGRRRPRGGADLRAFPRAARRCTPTTRS